MSAVVWHILVYVIKSIDNKVSLNIPFNNLFMQPGFQRERIY